MPEGDLSRLSEPPRTQIWLRPRRIALVVVLIMLLVAVLNPSPPPLRPSALPASDLTTTSASPPPTTSQPDVPQPIQHDVQELIVNLFQTGWTRDRNVGIGVKSVAGNITDRTGSDGKSISEGSGGVAGPGGGGVAVSAGGSNASGGSTSGAVDIFVITPAFSCRANGVSIGESVAVADSTEKWARIVLVAIGQFGPDLKELPVTFQVIQGQGNIPRSDRMCS